MILTSIQLKAKVRNMSGGDSVKAHTFIRNFIMERFLERVSLSEYKDNFILKGGMLVSSMVGLSMRATMDIDTTVRNIPLTKDDARRIVDEISQIEVEDNVRFEITNLKDIMEEHDYPGIRVFLNAYLDKLRQPIHIDISTGDKITPGAVEYSYRLMFEERTIPIWTYNLETVLGEKIETAMDRGVANTRMRDFYDIHVLTLTLEDRVDYGTLREAFRVTSEKRNTTQLIPQLKSILKTVRDDEAMRNGWDEYKKNAFYIEGVTWDDAMDSLGAVIDKMNV